jgi:large subunit ribosomal protein L15
MLRLHNLRPAAGATRKKKRVGRGIGSGHGKTATRGHKGQKSRHGYSRRIGYEGGQMPLTRRIPKRGFGNVPFRTEYAQVNVGRLNVFPAGTEVTPELLQERRVVRKLRDGVKVLGNGDLEVALKVRAHRFSAAAREKIVKAGGEALDIS